MGWGGQAEEYFARNTPRILLVSKYAFLKFDELLKPAKLSFAVYLKELQIFSVNNQYVGKNIFPASFFA